jgi:hypothetical protein
MIEDEQLLREYCERFFGYGAWNAKIWFVGMEEGGKGSSTAPFLNRRLEIWKRRGKRELESAPEFYGHLGYATEWFGLHPKPQATWKELIRVLLILSGENPTKETILNYQASQWAKDSDAVCIPEMFPLPAQSLAEWNYERISKLPFLINRTVYTHSLYEHRAKFLRSKIESSKPNVVIFYGTSYIHFWEGIVGQKFNQTRPSRLSQATLGNIPCFAMIHPTREMPEYFVNVGKHIKAVCNL